MVSFSFRTNNEELEAFRDITDDVIESDFVPYACHYNPHTLLTKNGELLQTIKVTGVAHELLGHQDANLRGTLREAIRDCITSDSFALWFHTIRREADLSAPGEFENDFARDLHQSWESRNRFKNQYTNEVYITIVHEGQDASIGNVQNFSKGLIPARDIRWRNEYLDETYENLNTVVEHMMEKLEAFGAHRLTFYEKEGEFYSELSQFLEKIINLVERPMPVEEQDLCTTLASGEITFGFNAMEVRTGNRRRFASIITIKEHKEASLKAIDGFLQLPIEFIVTQYVNFINTDTALEQYQDQKMLTELSGDDKLAKISEIDDIISSNANNPTSFGEQQMTVFILADSIKLLEKHVRRTVNYLFEYGIISIREDLRFEQCYWAQLPANFEFIKRVSPNSLSRIGGFANLHNFPVGKATGNHWGAAVTTFHTASGTPYFFNFHQKESGHTSIIGPYGSGKTVLTNFLVTQALKFNPRVFYFDTGGASKVFMELIGGAHCPVSMESTGQGIFNPFSLQASPANTEFIARWLIVLLRMAGDPVDDNQKAEIRTAAETTLSQPMEQRHFSRFIEILSEQSPETAAVFHHWREGGKHGHVFTATSDPMTTNPDIISFDLSAVMQEEAVLIPVFSYLLQRCMDVIGDDRPEILMIDEAWTLLRNSHVAGNIGGWLNRLTESNAIAILTTESIDLAGEQPFTPGLMSEMVTQIYLPNEDPSDVYQEAFGLDDLEFAYLDVMDLEERHFLIKRSGETIVGELNLAGLDHIIAGLSGQTLEEPEDADEDLPIRNVFSEG